MRFSDLVTATLPLRDNSDSSRRLARNHSVPSRVARWHRARYIARSVKPVRPGQARDFAHAAWWAPSDLCAPADSVARLRGFFAAHVIAASKMFLVQARSPRLT